MVVRFLRVTDEVTRPDLEQAIAHLRAKQRRCKMATYRAELAADIDELLDLWAAPKPVPA